MGVSVQDTGIAVEKGRYFLVNLNADPSLNEMLVYYLKPHTKVGKLGPMTSPRDLTSSKDLTSSPDIQLNGLGILAEHCVLDIEDDCVYLKPFQGEKIFLRQFLFENTALPASDPKSFFF